MQVVLLETFQPGFFRARALTQIQKTDLRLILVLASSDDTAQIVLAGQHEGMMAAGYAWVGSQDLLGAELTGTIGYHVVMAAY